MRDTVDLDARHGMGALPHDGGCAFRVWAPHAHAVFVTGDFCGWDETAHPMRPEDGGTWYADLSEAGVGHEYRFVLDTPGGRLSRIDPYAREVTSSVGNGVVTDLRPLDDGFCPPPWNEMVIYEMHVGTFAAEGGVGTFSDAAGHLDHLRSLGVNAVQIMPAAEFAGDVSWGYNPAHIFAVEQAYGGPAGLRGFVDAAHAAGIAVILDVVYNHFGPSDLDLWRFDGWVPEGTETGGIYFYNDWRAETPWGATRPDYGRPEVRSFIRDNALFWLETYGIDGLRFDMTLYMRNVSGDEGDPDHDLADGWSLVQEVNRTVAERFPGRITIAEDLREKDALTHPDGAAFGAQWDAAFVHPVRDVLTQVRDEDRSMAAVADALTRSYNGDPFERVVYTESHDEVANGKARVPMEVNEGDQSGWAAQKRATLGAALVMTAPGIPMMFQGQEFLQGDWFDDTVPLDWSQAETFRGIVRLWRDLIALRRDVDGPARGLSGGGIELLAVDDERKIVAFRRWRDEGEPGVLVVMNFAAEPAHEVAVPVPCEGPWRLRLNTDWKGYSRDFGGFETADAHVEPDGGSWRATLSVGPYSAAVLTL